MIEAQTITDQAALEACCARLRAAGVFAFDTEFIRDDTYDAALCLIQVSCDGEVCLIDPTANVDVRVFWELVCDPNVVTIVHAGKEDFELCLRTTGRPPRNVYDVQIAAGFAGYGYPMSLARLVEAMLHHRMVKGQTLTDWLRRPLTPAQIRYAVEDVVHLPELHRRLCAEIESLKRTAWVAEELAAFENPASYRIEPAERVTRLRGSKRLDGLGLLVLERLVEWRDRWAQSRNRPTRALIRDDILIEIARRRPRQESDLAVMRGFPQSRNRKVIREIIDLIEAASKIPRAEWPTPQEHREESAMYTALLDLLSAMTHAICYKERLSRNLIGGTQRLRELLDYHAGRTEVRPALLTGWRDAFIGRRLASVLEGRSEIHLSGWPDAPALEVVSHPAADGAGPAGKP